MMPLLLGQERQDAEVTAANSQDIGRNNHDMRKMNKKKTHQCSRTFVMFVRVGCSGAFILIFCAFNIQRSVRSIPFVWSWPTQEAKIATAEVTANDGGGQLDFWFWDKSISTSSSSSADTISRTAETTTSRTTTSFQEFKSGLECRLALEPVHNQRINDWLDHDVPTMEGVISFDGYQHILFGSIPVNDRAVFDASWNCGVGGGNSQNDTIVSITRLQFGKGVRLLQCPNHANDSDGFGAVVSHVWPSVPATKTGVVPYYDLRHYQICDALEEHEFRQINHQRLRSGSDPIKLGACVIFRGQASRKVLPEWIAYHKILGIQHFWIFLNELFTLTGLPEPLRLPYITYVPYNYVFLDHTNHTSYHKPFEDVMWQMPMQMTCLYKAKKYGLDWITTIDSDEFIHITDPNISTNIDEGALTRFLTQYNASQIGALHLMSVPYGRNRRRRHPFVEEPLLTMDYTWRNRVYNRSWHREKLIYSVPNARSIGVHYLWASHAPHPASHVYLNQPDRQAYVHHYRRPWEGIFRSRNPADWEQDTTLRDAYRDKVLFALKQMNITTTTAVTSDTM